jgi:aerobic-type carbon monoxide dehydrogenase small subunit (CoxS/CutS family)
MPKLREAIGWTKTKIYCKATVCRRCVLIVPWTIKAGLTKVGNQAKKLKYSEEKLYFIPI